MGDDVGPEAFIRQQKAVIGRPDSRPSLAWIRCPTLVLTGYYAAGLIDGKPWLKAAALWLSITFFAVGTAYGIWRYRQEMHRPAEPVAVGSG